MKTDEYVICMYIRLSAEDSDIYGDKVESGSITMQREVIYDFIRNNKEFDGCTIIEKCDDGFSGTHFDTRPRFVEMMELAKKGKINCIIVKDFSRFGRDYVELGNYLEQLFPFMGIRFISINDGYDSATLKEGETGGLDVAFKNLIYDFYARETSKKLRLSWKQAAEKGYYKAAQTLYGYEKSGKAGRKLVIDPESSAIVREIFDMKLSGIGTSQIARILNDRGVLAPTEYAYQKGRTINHARERVCYWDPTVIEKLLQNEKYTGTMVNLKTQVNRISGEITHFPPEQWVRVENTHEAIVTKEEFDRVQQSMGTGIKRSKHKIKIHYRCGSCGRHLVRMNRDIIWCRTERVATESICNFTHIRKDVLDNMVLEQLKEHLRLAIRKSELQKKMRSCKSEEHLLKEIAIIQKTIESNKRTWMKLYEDYKDGHLDRAAFVEKKKAYDATNAELEAKVVELQKDTFGEDKQAIKNEEICSILEAQELTEEMWERFITDVIVYPETKLEINWKFEEIGDMAV